MLANPARRGEMGVKSNLSKFLAPLALPSRSAWLRLGLPYLWPMEDQNGLSPSRHESLDCKHPCHEAHGRPPPGDSTERVRDADGRAFEEAVANRAKWGRMAERANGIALDASVAVGHL